ncbi:MAG: DNA polymerase I, partial [Elusimicrobia bacterium]|nr:DNA polymerase I [Elusimicrobiota bacterium]
MSKKTIFIIDAHAFLHRSYHALPKLSTSKGEEVGALYGFLRLLLKIIKEHKPDYAAVCFDSPGKTFRDELFSGYKANRPEIDDGLISQLKQAPELPGAVGLKAVALPGYEADDIIATLAERFSLGGAEVVIVTGDKDAAQLVRDGVKLWDGSAALFSGEAEVLAKFGVRPSQIADFLALTGDSSDNVPGVAGIGPKSAAKLLSAYGALENILAAAAEREREIGTVPILPLACGSPVNRDSPLDKLLAKAAAGAAEAALSKRLCVLDRNAPVPFETEDFLARGPDAALAGELARRFEFRDLAALGERSQAGLFDAPLPPEISLDDALAQAANDKFLCLASDGGALCAGSDKGAAFIAPGGLGEQEKKKLSAVIADAGILKAAAGLKKAMHLLDFDPGVEPGNFFELEIVQSLLSARKADLSKMVFERAGAFPRKEGSKEELLAAMGVMPGLCEALKKDLRAVELEKVYEELERPLITVIYAMERTGFGVDTGLLSRLSSDFARRLAEIETEAETLTGHKINLNSPKQLAWLLYEKLNIQLDDGQKKMFKTKDGYSTAEEALTLLLPAHPVIEKLLEFRELSKLKSSFVDNLLAAADAQGRVHSTFEQTGTSTGRFSSSKPNLQNIPVRSAGGQEVRRAFIAKPGCSLLSADYSQIDLRVLAHVSGDRSLAGAFRADEDIHLRTASEVFNTAPELVTKEMRRTAKAINFGIVYGQTAQGLARGLGIPRTDAAKYIKHYFEVYSGVKAWIDRTVEEAKIKGSVYTFTGRRRAVPDITGSNPGMRA